jgi:Zn-dependent protease
VLISKPDETVIEVLVKWSAFLYFTLSLFHFIPAFPLDGGRILHVILWKAFGNTRQTIRIASWIGWIIGLLITLGGIPILVFTVEKFTGVFLIGIGLVLQNAATHSLRQPDQVITSSTEV